MDFLKSMLRVPSISSVCERSDLFLASLTFHGMSPPLPPPLPEPCFRLFFSDSVLPLPLVRLNGVVTLATAVIAFLTIDFSLVSLAFGFTSLVVDGFVDETL